MANRRQFTKSSKKQGNTKTKTSLKSVRKTESSSELSDTDDGKGPETSDDVPTGDDTKGTSAHSTEKTKARISSSGSDFKEARKVLSKKRERRPLASPSKVSLLHCG